MVGKARVVKTMRGTLLRSAPGARSVSVRIQINKHPGVGTTPPDPEAVTCWESLYAIEGFSKAVCERVESLAKAYGAARAISLDGALQFACCLVPVKAPKHQHAWARRYDDGTTYCATCGIER